MLDRFLAGLPALLVPLGAVGLYYLGSDVSWVYAGAAALALLLLGYGSLALGGPGCATIPSRACG